MLNKIYLWLKKLKHCYASCPILTLSKVVEKCMNSVSLSVHLSACPCCNTHKCSSIAMKNDCHLLWHARYKN